MQKVGYLFFAAWMLCGCAVDSMLDDWRSCIIAVVALIVAIVSVAMIGDKHENT